jgi:hypothetical protein
MEWLLNFHMDFWIHREREREGGIFFFLCARASTQRWIYVYVYSLLFFVRNETLNDKLENGQRRGEHNACKII